MNHLCMTSSIQSMQKQMYVSKINIFCNLNQSNSYQVFHICTVQNKTRIVQITLVQITLAGQLCQQIHPNRPNHQYHPDRSVQSVHPYHTNHPNHLTQTIPLVQKKLPCC